MGMIKRIAMFAAVNIAFVVIISLILSLLGIGSWVGVGGVNFGSLVAFGLVVGFSGSFLSLLISKPMAKWSTGAKTIDGSEGNMERFLMETVKVMSRKVGIKAPEVAIYESSEPNAFATGAFKNAALVAVSTGLIQNLSRSEVEAVVGHEIGHVANGDMVSMALVQGVVNTFVTILARLASYAVSLASSSDEESATPNIFVTLFFDLVLGILAMPIVAWFSRQREFRADRAGAELTSVAAMTSALASLHRVSEGAELPAGLQTAGIGGKPSMMALFSTHPPVEERIAALRNTAR